MNRGNLAELLTISRGLLAPRGNAYIMKRAQSMQPSSPSTREIRDRGTRALSSRRGSRRRIIEKHSGCLPLSPPRLIRIYRVARAATARCRYSYFMNTWHARIHGSPDSRHSRYFPRVSSEEERRVRFVAHCEFRQVSGRHCDPPR